MVNWEEETLASPMPTLDIFTFEGLAGVGKGTTVAAVSAALHRDQRQNVVIDQGLTFRGFGYEAINAGVDIGDSCTLGTFLESDRTHITVVGLLGRVSAMSKTEADGLLRTATVTAAAAEIARHPAAQELAVRMLFGRVEDARAGGIRAALIDGRALRQYGDEMQKAGLGLHLLNFTVLGDSAICASRALGDHRDVADMPDADLRAWATEVQRISRRNDKDARRGIDPLQYPDGAVNLDLVRGLPVDEGDCEELFERMRRAGAVALYTSHTDSRSQMTEPVVDVVRYLVRDADRQRRNHEMLRAAVIDVLDRLPEALAETG